MCVWIVNDEALPVRDIEWRLKRKRKMMMPWTEGGAGFASKLTVKRRPATFHEKNDKKRNRKRHHHQSWIRGTPFVIIINRQWETQGKHKVDKNLFMFPKLFCRSRLSLTRECDDLFLVFMMEKWADDRRRRDMDYQNNRHYREWMFGWKMMRRECLPIHKIYLSVSFDPKDKTASQVCQLRRIRWLMLSQGSHTATRIFRLLTSGSTSNRHVLTNTSKLTKDDRIVIDNDIKGVKHH
jgi:hypothetical protein